MKKSLILFGLVVSALMYYACTAGREDDDNGASSADTTAITGSESAGAMSHQDSVDRGKYLSLIMGCNDCHTPKMMTEQGPEPNPALTLSGHPAAEKIPPIEKRALASGWMLFSQGLTAWVGPWGTSYAANLTPDETGTGNWTIENFRKVIREGKFKGQDGGRMILPPMPWQMYRNITDADLAYLWAYLQSLPPISNVVPAAEPPVM